MKRGLESPNESNVNLTNKGVAQGLSSWPTVTNLDNAGGNVTNGRNIFEVPVVPESQNNLPILTRMNISNVPPANLSVNGEGFSNNNMDGPPTTLNWPAVLQELSTAGKSITNIYEQDGQNLLWISPKQYSLLHAAMHAAYHQEGTSGIGWEIATKMIKIQPLLVKCPLGSTGEYPIVTAIEKYSTGNRKPEYYVFLSCLMRGAPELLPFIPTLIHLAFKKGLPRNLAVYLLRANPKACSVFDEDGFLPLHRLCDTTEVIDTVLLDEVMRLQPRAVVVKTKGPPCLTPMQLLQRNNSKISLDDFGQGAAAANRPPNQRDAAADPTAKNKEPSATSKPAPGSQKQNPPLPVKKPKTSLSSADPNIYKKESSSEVIELLDDSDDEDVDDGKISLSSNKSDSHSRLKSQTKTAKNTNKRKTSEVKVQRLSSLRDLDQQIEFYNKSIEKSKTTYASKVEAFKIGGVDVMQDDITSQVQLKLKQEMNTPRQPNTAQTGLANNDTEDQKNLQDKEKKLIAEKKNLEVKSHALTVSHNDKLSSIRDSYSTKLSSRFKTYRQQIQVSQECHEKELKKLKTELLSLQKEILIQISTPEESEVTPQEADGIIKAFIAKQNSFHIKREDTFAKQEEKKKHLEETIRKDAEAFRQKEDNLIKNYKQQYEENERNYRKRMADLYSEIHKVHIAKKNEKNGIEDGSKQGKQSANPDIVPTATIGSNEMNLSQDDVAMSLVSKLRDDIEFLEDTVDDLRRQEEKRKKYQNLWQDTFHEKTPNIPHLIKESKGDTSSVNEDNDETEVVNIMDEEIDEDELSVTSDGGMYGIYERN